MGYEKGKVGYSVLERTVIKRGLCTSCGTCVGVCPERRLGIRWIDGDAEPYLAKEPCSECGSCWGVCPGQDVPLPDLEEMIFSQRRGSAQDPVGVYLQAFVAHARAEEIRTAGGSGGVASALFAHALDKGQIEAALVAGFDDHKPYRAVGRLVSDSRELPRFARSKYGGNPPLNALLAQADQEGVNRLGVIGCPCHVHGVRKLQRLDRLKEIARRIKLVLGLFCASQLYFEGTRQLLTEYCGVTDLDDIAMIDYRWGDWPGRFYVKTRSGREAFVDMDEYIYRHLFLGWQRDRCVVCLDHCAELADIALGDYWPPKAKPGDPGWTLVIARSQLGLETLRRAEKDGYLVMKEIDLDQSPPAGTQLKKRRNPFLHKRRQRYGMAVPDFGLRLDHEPGPIQPGPAPEGQGGGAAAED